MVMTSSWIFMSSFLSKTKKWSMKKLKILYLDGVFKKKRWESYISMEIRFLDFMKKKIMWNMKIQFPLAENWDFFFQGHLLQG